MSSCPATLKPRANSNHSWSRTLVIGLAKCVYSFSLTLRFSLEPFNDVWQCGPGTITCNCNHTVCVTCYFIGSVTSRLRRRRGALPPPRPAPRSPTASPHLYLYLFTFPSFSPGRPFGPFCRRPAVPRYKYCERACGLTEFIVLQLILSRWRPPERIPFKVFFEDAQFWFIKPLVSLPILLRPLCVFGDFCGIVWWYFCLYTFKAAC